VCAITVQSLNKVEWNFSLQITQNRYLLNISGGQTDKQRDGHTEVIDS
jgi:hypothetical protein